MQITKKISGFISGLNLHKHKFLISVVWILGLVIGMYISQISPWSFISAQSISNSILLYPDGMLIMISSMLIGCLACIISHRLLYIFLFLKAVVFAIVSTNIVLVFKDAGWLLRTLLLSTDTSLIIIFLLFSIRSVGKHFDTIMRNAAITTIVLSILISFDLYFTIPFTTSLLNG